jgi:choline dehydrogenase-like flavoprotein
MSYTSHYDVIIIGSGARGGTLAFALADSGKRILILERGTWLPREKENWDGLEVFVKERYHTTELRHDRNGKPFRPGTNYGASVRGARPARQRSD